jgi:type I restriction enzyme S subunit
LFYYLDYSIPHLARLNQGTSINGITRSTLIKHLIKLPPLPEQQKIAQILTTWDKAIEKTEQLIQAKTQLKKGLMKQLLTGKKRFKEFDGEDLKSAKIGELLDYEQPNNYITDEILENKTDSCIPVLTANKSFVLGFTKNLTNVYDNLPVIIFDDFTTDNKFVNFLFKVKSSAIKMLSPKGHDSNLRFVFERMQLIRVNISEHKRRYISEYQHIKIKIPSIHEQNKIAHFFTLIEKEIENLRIQSDMMKMQKKGLMQKLLTGEVRVKIDY